jgi:inorganic triphosphatase YgiF
MRLQDNLEVELKLCVTGDDPDALLDEVAKLRQLGALRLESAGDHRLRDVYWDLPDGGMRALKLSLRLREIDDRLVFTAKGGTSSSEGLFRRYELEVPATPENWVALRAVLVDEGVALGDDLTGEDPAGWLRSAGLTPTQDRTTWRTIRYAYPSLSEARPLAELALDRTRFDFDEVTVDYWEIEIEQLGGGDEAPLQLGEALLELYPDRLEPSSMGKYSRGLAIERELRASGQLAGRRR